MAKAKAKAIPAKRGTKKASKPARKPKPAVEKETGTPEQPTDTAQQSPPPWASQQ